MSLPPTGRGPVVVDTGVFAAELVRRGSPLAESYRPLLEGRPFVVSFMTAAEIRFGAKLAGWGTARLQRMEHQLSRPAWGGPGTPARRGVCRRADDLCTGLQVNLGHGRPGHQTGPQAGGPLRILGRTVGAYAT